MGILPTITSRPGGNTQKLEANAYWRTLLSERVTLGLVAYAADYIDSEGYSRLLDHNNRRSIHRLGQRAELVWQLPKTTQWALQAEIYNFFIRSR